MNKDTEYWLRRVAVKLYKDFMAGMDFEHDEFRWIFDWNENLTTEQNFEHVVAEDKALILLTQLGVIQSGAKPNYFRDQQYEGWQRFGKDSGGMWGERWEQTDPAHREYDYIRFIDNLDYDKFIGFCTEHGINYKDEGVVATLTITEQKPSVRAEGETYTLKTLASGSTLDIIELIKTNLYFDKPATFADLRRWLNSSNAFTEQKYFTQIFRKGNVFHEGNALSPFANIQPQSFTLKSTAQLTPSQLSAIQKTSIK